MEQPTPDDTLSFLKLEPIFGDLIRDETFTAVYSEMVKALYDTPDISQTMQTLLQENRA